MKKFRMKALIALCLTLMTSLCLAACGGGSEAGGSSDSSKGPDPKAALATGEWEGPSGKYRVDIVGAELFVDAYDGDAIRVYYDFYNVEGNIFSVSYADETGNASYLQDGEELSVTYAYKDVPERGNDLMSVRPGYAIRCVDEYSVTKDGGAVSVALYPDDVDEPVVSYEFDLANLPGAPAAELAKSTVSDPKWIEKWPSEGVYHDDYRIAITGSEITKDWDGEPLLRVFMEFTNNSDEADSMDWVVYDNRAFQDGVQIQQGSPETIVETDGNYSIDVAPGETVKASYCYKLNGTSPVEVELVDPWADGITSGSDDIGIGLVIAVD